MTLEEKFWKNHGARWRMITREKAYKEAIETAKRVHPAFQILDKGLAEMKGVGDLMLAQQQAAIQLFDILETLANVPGDYGDEEPPESELNPSDLEEAAAEPMITKRRR